MVEEMIVMMGRREAPGQLFYDFSLERHVPADHLLRRIDAVLDLSIVSPLRKIYSKALVIVRSDHFAGRPSRDRGGSSGSRTAHSSSVRSLEYCRPFRACLRRVVSVHMSMSVGSSHLQRNHKSLKSPNFISGQPLTEGSSRRRFGGADSALPGALQK